MDTDDSNARGRLIALTALKNLLTPNLTPDQTRLLTHALVDEIRKLAGSDTAVVGRAIDYAEAEILQDD